MMKVVEYEDKYKEDLKDLLVQLQQYIVKIDDRDTQVMLSEYREEYFKLLINNVKDNNGKIFLAIMDDEIVGAIAGTVEKKDEIDKLTNRCPKRGKVDELIIKDSKRGLGIGKELINKIEEYFKNLDCEFVAIDVFGPNKGALNFYEKAGYNISNLELMKKI